MQVAQLRRMFVNFLRRDQAIVVGQALMNGKWITSIVTHDTRFRDDHTLYRPVEVSLYECLL